MNMIEPREILVHVACTEPLLALGLAAALRRLPGLRVVVPALESPASAPERADVFVTDHAGGLAVLAEQRRGAAGVLQAARVLIVAAQDREHDVRVALECGVQGYLLVSCDLDELSEAVRAVARGTRHLGMAVARRMADSLTREALTPRESQVLHFVARGECNKSIARRLDISVGTVKTHLKGIMCKLDAASRTHAVTIASGRGLVDPVRTEALPSPVMRFGPAAGPARLDHRHFA